MACVLWERCDGALSETENNRMKEWMKLIDSDWVYVRLTDRLIEAD